MNPNPRPTETFYLIMSSLMILAISPHFIIRYYLEKIKNKKVNKVHQFILIFEIIAFLVVFLFIYPFPVVFHRNLFDYITGNPDLVFGNLSFYLLLFSPLIWVIFFTATKFYFKIKAKESFVLFLITSLICLGLIALNFFVFYTVIEPNFKYCIESFLCTR